MRKKIFVLFALLAFSLFAMAQQKIVTGVVTDKVIGEPLIGVNVVYGPGLGVVTDVEGTFILNLEAGEYDLEISYIGFITQKKHITVGDKNIYVNFSLETVTLNEVEVIGDIAQTRETPVAFSNISPAKIEEQLAAQDIPLILNSTPGVYATAGGGGDGDARINIRGFNQRNVAVMLDGIPVNDMENGWVYWSNWFGLDMVMRGTQVQRGLGMSKLAIPAIGGTINITTKGIDNKKGISIKQELGTAGFTRTSLGMTSGRLENGWGVTFAGSYKKGNGWVDQTYTEGWFYFLRVDKEIGKHLVSFTAMGAPQKHGQRSYKKRISTFDSTYAVESGMSPETIEQLRTDGVPTNMGLRYNPNWGYLSTRAYKNDTGVFEYPNNTEVSTASNYYYKPMFSLRDFWSVNDRLYISNVLYLSLGSGGGRSFSNGSEIDINTNQVDIQSAYNNNANLNRPTSSIGNPYRKSDEILRNGVNNHFWLGLLSTFDYKINDAFSLSGGVDMRTYRAEHYREVADLLGGRFFNDTGDQNESSETRKYEGNKIGYNNDALVRWGGLFAQLKYQNGNLTTFINLTGSVSGFKRIDYFLPKTMTVDGTTFGVSYSEPVDYNGTLYTYQSPGLVTNETDWKYIPGFTVKGGANYNISETFNVFMNLGYLSKAQRFQNVFDRNNKLFLEIKNEKIKAIELGSSFVKPRFTLNFNAYYTVWDNKPSDKRIPKVDPEDPENKYTININNMNALHMGVEFEFAYRITDDLMFESILSLGDWRWTSADTAIIYDDDGKYIGEQPFDAKGLYVGDAAQFQNRESLRWQITKGLYASGSFTWFGKHYAEFNPMDYDPSDPNKDYAFDENGDPRQSWKIPNYYTVDFHAGYYWRIKDYGFQVRGSVINALDDIFITDAQNNDSYLARASTTFDASSAGVFMGMGRRFNVSLKITF